MKKILGDSMAGHDVVIVTYKSGISHRGWVSECNGGARDAVMMIDGRENHAINIRDVFSVAITRQFF